MLAFVAAVALAFWLPWTAGAESGDCPSRLSVWSMESDEGVACLAAAVRAVKEHTEASQCLVSAAERRRVLCVACGVFAQMQAAVAASGCLRQPVPAPHLDCCTIQAQKIIGEVTFFGANPSTEALLSRVASVAARFPRFAYPTPPPSVSEEPSVQGSARATGGLPASETKKREHTLPPLHEQNGNVQTMQPRKHL